MMRGVIKLLFKSVLFLLEIGFAITRKRTPSPFPYDKKRQKIILPAEEKKKIRHLVATGCKIEAVRRVTQLTGANLRVSKDYVDSLV
jgi:hypothetical protein